MESGRSSASSDSIELLGRMDQENVVMNGHIDSSPTGDSGMYSITHLA